MAVPQIIGLGLTTIDVLIRLSELPSWERGGGRASEVCMDGGGPSGTGICAAARLGARVGYVGTYGSDEPAQMKMQFLTRDGVDISHAVQHPGPEQQIVLCYVQEGTGERMFSMGRLDPGIFLSADQLDRDYITQADYLHLDGFHYEAALTAADWMHEAGKQVMLDAGKSTGRVDEKMRRLVQCTDLLICGSGFAPGLTGCDDRWEAGQALLAMGPSVVVMTEGEEGSYTLTATERFHTPAFRVPVVDTTGAGDVFHGAYLAGRLRGYDLRQAALFASAASALKCTHLGGRVGIPRAEAVEAFLKDQGFALS